MLRTPFLPVTSEKHCPPHLKFKPQGRQSANISSYAGEENRKEKGNTMLFQPKWMSAIQQAATWWGRGLKRKSKEPRVPEKANLGAGQPQKERNRETVIPTLSQGSERRGRQPSRALRKLTGAALGARVPFRRNAKK